MIYDISVTIEPNMVLWPGDGQFTRTFKARMADGAPCNTSYLQMPAHAGTHIDAPLHFVDQAPGIESLAPQRMIGPAQVISLLQVDQITADDLATAPIATGTRRLLLHTRNSRHWAQGDQSFDEQFVGLAADAAQWLVDHAIDLVGIDYLSVQRFEDGPATHQILLGAGVIALEAINLHQVPDGIYQLICLPLKIKNGDGAPARAVLID